MVPVIAIVGRPNVGKSTLFNVLTKSRDAMVADQPGVTRDRQYGQGSWGDQPYIVIDTGGIGGEHAGIEGLTAKQAEQALREANLILFVVDARRGCMPADKVIAEELRKLNKSLLVVVNKTDGMDATIALTDFFNLGLGKPIAISAAHQQGIDELVKQTLRHFPADATTASETMAGIKVAIAGRPNVGKSTLVNRMLGEERVIVFDAPGTTRDSIYIPLQRLDKKYVLIDTAGVRRRSQVTEVVEKISVVKTLQAINAAQVVIMLLDAREGVTEQDLNLLGFILESGKALVIAVNKWDGLSTAQREEVKRGAICIESPESAKMASLMPF